MGGYPDYMVLVSTRGVHPPKPMMHILHISEHVSESIWEGHASFPTPAWQVAGGTNLPMSFPLNCGQRFSVPQCSFRAQQRLGGPLASPLASWMRKRLRPPGGQATDDDDGSESIKILAITFFKQFLFIHPNFRMTFFSHLL